MSWYPEPMTSPLNSDRIIPVKATCGLHLFENSSIGVRPSLTFGVGVDCRPLQWTDEDGEECESELSMDIDSVPFPGRTWRDIADLDIRNVECFMELDGPEPSVFFDEIHHRMGRLSLRVTAVRGTHVDLRIVMEEDIDSLGVDRLEVAVTATFAGAGGHTEDPTVTMRDFLDTDGLVEDSAGHWKPVAD